MSGSAARLRARSRESPGRRAARPRRRGAANRRQRSSCSGAASSASSAARKIAGSGFSAPTRMAIRHDAEQGSETRALAHRFEVAVEVRHDAEPVARAQVLRAPAGCARKWSTCQTGNARQRSGRARAVVRRASEFALSSRFAPSARTVSGSPAARRQALQPAGRLRRRRRRQKPRRS